MQDVEVNSHVPQAAHHVQQPVHKPLYGQVRDKVMKRISSGEWRTGQSLPNEFALASEFGVSIGTIRRALEGLERQGVITRKQGRGTFVTSPGRELYGPGVYPLKAIAGKADIVRETLSVKQRRAAPMERQLMRWRDSDLLVEVTALLRVAGRAVGRERSLVSAVRLARGSAGCASIDDVRIALSESGQVAKWTEDLLRMVYPEAELAAQLGISDGVPLLQCRRVSYLFDETPLEVWTAEFLSTDLEYFTRTS